MNYNFNLAISPCPNDTFIAYALIHNKVKLEGINIDVRYLDIENLNQLAISNNIDIVKISTAIIPKIQSSYKILNSGAALGHNCGPKVIVKSPSIILESKSIIGMPGMHTSANQLFVRYFGLNYKFHQMIFSEIENSVLNNLAQAGVIIHENRFTFKDNGLHELCDLGEKWHQETKLPLPLGCFAISNKIPNEIQTKIDQALSKSIKYAFANYDEVMKFVKKHAQTMSEEIARKHIDLYVTDESICLSKIGKQSILKFIDKPNMENSSTFDDQNLFV